MFTPVVRLPQLIVEQAAFTHRPGVKSADRSRMIVCLPVQSLERAGTGLVGFFIRHAPSVLFLFKTETSTDVNT
jgi:hypothetical protein